MNRIPSQNLSTTRGSDNNKGRISRKKISRPEMKKSSLLRSSNCQHTQLTIQSMHKPVHSEFQRSFFEYRKKKIACPNLQTDDLKQQWENNKIEEGSEEVEISKYNNSAEILFAFCTMVCLTFTIWLANVEFFFGYNKSHFISSKVYIVPLVLVVLDFLATYDFSQVSQKCMVKKIVPDLVKPLLCVIYFILKISQIEIQCQPQWLILEIPCLYMLYLKASKFYTSFRVMSLSKKYEYHFKAFGLLFNLIIVAHIVAIILYQITLIGEEVSWRNNIGIEDKSSLINYIYSFYFGVTTILTVGYGDISPANEYEITVVCFVELFGIAIFAYLINEIGYNLSTLRKDTEVMERDLSILQKCRQYYKIDQDLIVRARANLMGKIEASNRLKPEEQQSLTIKFNQTLRKQLMQSSRLAIVKSSIFMLCRWSKQFQKAIASSLVSALYVPGEELMQPLSKERIYIIKLGKVDFYRSLKGNKKQAQKVIKSINVTLNTEVSNNSFGYTAVLGRKPTDLIAISRDFTSAYYVDKDDLLHCIQQNPNDFEYSQQLRDKIEQSRFPEALEIPSLSSSKLHFNPMRYYLIKRFNTFCGQFKNKRGKYDRANRYYTKFNELISNLATGENVKQLRQDLISSLEEVKLREELECSQSQLTGPNQQNTMGENSNSEKVNILRGNTLKLNAQKGNSLKGIRVQGQLIKRSQSLMGVANRYELMQGAKQYQNYYPVQNCSQVLKRLELNTFVKKSHPRAAPLSKKSGKSLKYSAFKNC